MSIDKPEEPPNEDPKVILRKSLDDAFTLYVHDHLTAARDKYTAIIGTDAENKEAFLNAEARFWRGLITGHMDKFDEAESDFSELLNIGEERNDPTSCARGIAGLAFIHFKQEKYKDAHYDAQNALKADPNDPFVHCILGDAYWGLKRSKDAVAEYKKAVGLDSKCFFAQDSIGFVEWQILLEKWEQHEKEDKPLGKDEKEDQARSPIRQYRRALETRPDYVNALWNYAMVCAKIGKEKYTRKALELGREILKYNPEHQRAKDLVSSGSTIKLKIREE